MIKLSLNVPPLDDDGEKLAESRPARVSAWLEETLKRDTVTAARLIGDAVAATNRVGVSDARRLELGTLYGKASSTLWIPLQKRFVKAPQPLTGDAQHAARAAVVLAADQVDTVAAFLRAGRAS